MAVTYKDIGQLTQKSSLAGTEKIVVSDTQYITPAQIAASATPTVDTALSDSSTNAVQNKVIKAEFHKVVYFGTPTGDSASTVEYATENYVDTAVSNALGDIETLLAAL